MHMSDIEPFGAYCNAGFADVYHCGKHLRLGLVDADGSVSLTPDGARWHEETLLLLTGIPTDGDLDVPPATEAAPPATEAAPPARARAAKGALDDLLAA